MTGQSLYSLSSGWQLANNALYIRDHLDLQSEAFPTPQTMELDNLWNKYHKHTNNLIYDYYMDYEPDIFIRNYKSPLNFYYRSHYKPQNNNEALIAYANASAAFADYGNKIIGGFPGAYARYFIAKNFRHYLLPLTGSLDSYNAGKSDVSPIIQDWFDYQTPTITYPSRSIKEIIFFIFPYIFCLFNILYAGSVIWCLLRKGAFHWKIPITRTALLATIFLIVNCISSVATSVVVLQIMLFPMLICLSFSLLLIQLLDKTEGRSSRLALTTQATHKPKIA
jgi:hypothetical protein